jgi:hypothetical protein
MAGGDVDVAVAPTVVQVETADWTRVAPVVSVTTGEEDNSENVSAQVMHPYAILSPNCRHAFYFLTSSCYQTSRR